MAQPNKAKASSAAKAPASPAAPTAPRRGFFASTFAVLGGAISLASPVAVAVVPAFTPLREKAGGGRFLRLTTLDMLPADGRPRKFPVILDRTDGWNTFAQEPVGAVYLLRTADEKLTAFQVECPHAGCFLSYDEKANNFYCPCHSAHFGVGGERLESPSQSLRDLDTLPVEIRNETEVWVEFQRFRVGTAEKIPV